MQTVQSIREVVDLTEPQRNLVFNMSLEEARQLVAGGDSAAVRGIEGHFALAARRGHIVRMARTLSVPMRYFLAKADDGPLLVVAHRIDAIARWLCEHGYADQFHPSYTRMVPAHYVTEIALVGCPDPNPAYQRYFSPRRGTLPPDLDIIGHAYVSTLYNAIARWLQRLDEKEPIGVCFSGGIDSGAVFVLTYHALLNGAKDRELGMNPARLKAFTLSVHGGGADLAQARRFLEALDLQLFHEPVEVPRDWIDYREAVRVTEDYKPLDIQAGAMLLALCRGIRDRYPDWRYLIDGDGGDENLKDYPIEENPELTIRSVLNNPLLYQEGWGVHSIKHSLTYSGGLSRGTTRTFAPTAAFGFTAFSPFTLPAVVEAAEAIPFIDLTDWQPSRLYRLKGEVVARGIRQVTGMDMPIFQKRRFQHGALSDGRFSTYFPESQQAYRRAFLALYDGCVTESAVG